MTTSTTTIGVKRLIKPITFPISAEVIPFSAS